jgi:hypothetical protein
LLLLRSTEAKEIGKSAILLQLGPDGQAPIAGLQAQKKKRQALGFKSDDFCHLRPEFSGKPNTRSGISRQYRAMCTDSNADLAVNTYTDIVQRNHTQQPFNLKV